MAAPAQSSTKGVPEFPAAAAGGGLSMSGVIVKTECDTLTFSSSGSSLIPAGKTGRLTLSPSCYELHIPAAVKGILGNSGRDEEKFAKIIKYNRTTRIF